MYGIIYDTIAEKQKIEEVIQDAEVRSWVNEVKGYVNREIPKRNLFGWRFFIQDVEADIEQYIYYEEAEWRDRKSKSKSHLGIGAFCRKAMQIALNYSEQCSTHIRRLNFEALSLDTVWDAVEDPCSTFADRLNLIISIEQELGEHVADLAQTVLDGGTLSREELNELRKYGSRIKGLLA